MTWEVQMGAKFALALSFKNLINYKPLDKITVQDIVKKCGVVRRTFYNHFNNKQDLINWIYETNAYNIRSKFMGSGGWEKTSAMLFSHVKENQQFYYNALTYEEKDIFLKFLYKNTADAYIRYIRNNFGADKLTDHLLFEINFFSYAAVDTMARWTEKRMTECPDVMAKKVISSMPTELIKFGRFSSLFT
ncbi:MAG: TetR/AcrR family transcriptional regulator C-terminal domain-containing protein [Smithellaceae bacterium]